MVLYDGFDEDERHDELEYLRARIAELEAECGYSEQEQFDIAGKRCGRDFYWAAMSVIKPLQDKTSELEAERAELVKDAERYRWLKDEDNWGCDNPSGEASESRWGDLGELHGDAFDAFIDAAREGE